MTDKDIFDRAEPGSRKQHKRHILRCALHCFSVEGVEATTIEKIRVKADSSIGSMYHHFGSKEGLLAALYFIALDDQLALMQPRMENAASAKEAIAALVGSYMEWVTQEATLARVMFQARSSVASGPHKESLAERNQQRYGALLKWLAKGVEAGVIRALPKEVYASLIIGQSENYSRAWLSGRVKGAPTDHAAIFIEAAWRSISV